MALFMENRPEFVICWLGMTKAGIEVALINTSIKQKGLVHCVKISDCKMMLFGTELQASLNEVKEELESSGIMPYSEGNDPIDFAQSANDELKTVIRSLCSHELRYYLLFSNQYPKFQVS